MMAGGISLRCRSGTSRQRGMTLAEVMGVLLIASMVMAAVLGLYGRLFNTAQGVMERLETEQRPEEILHLIAEDLDTLVADGQATRVTLLPPKYDSGYYLSRLEIRRAYLDDAGQEQLLESIIWQTAYDVMSERLVLYRAHQGVIQEDPLLDGKRNDNESQYPFVPICGDLSLFRIYIPQGEELEDVWQKESLPPGVQISLSFAQPSRSPRGEMEVLEEEMTWRTIAVDRTRLIKFEASENEVFGDANMPLDPSKEPTATPGTQSGVGNK